VNNKLNALKAAIDKAAFDWLKRGLVLYERIRAIREKIVFK
jgi:hypothetical protein